MLCAVQVRDFIQGIGVENIGKRLINSREGKVRTMRSSSVFVSRSGGVGGFSSCAVGLRAAVNPAVVKFAAVVQRACDVCRVLLA